MVLYPKWIRRGCKNLDIDVCVDARGVVWGKPKQEQTEATANSSDDLETSGRFFRTEYVLAT